MIRILIILLFTVITTVSFSQSKKKKQKEKQVNGQPTSLNPFYPEQSQVPKKAQAKSKGITYNSQAKYKDQLNQVAKANRKAEKEMMKPQYSDFSYFGHKHPPKKHKAGKLKFCKECGLRH